MKHFIISDTHFNHKNIIEYAKRPFDSVEQMNEYIISQWNSVVSPDDVVYHLGDFGFGNRTTVKGFAKRLNGHIILIKGNHDRFPNGVYESAGLTVVKYGEINVQQIGEANGLPIYASHKPPLPVYPLRCDRWFFFGHLHQFVDNVIEENNRSICCCVERLNYTPLCLEDLFKEREIDNVIFYEYEDGFKKEKELADDIASESAVFIPEKKCKTLDEAIKYVKKHYTDELDEEYDIKETYMRFLPILNPETDEYGIYMETTPGKGAMKGWKFEV